MADTFTIDVPVAGAYVCTLITEQPHDWAFPIGSAEYPPEQWYCATRHDPTGALNNGYRHTGIDINLDLSPWGDIERTLGLGVYAVADGVVTHVSQNWYGPPMIVIRHEHEGEPLYTRYAHIVPVVTVGDKVTPGKFLGLFADWATGDHLHLDMTRTPYTREWFTGGMLDPIDVLKAHLPQDKVDAMCKKGG